METAPDNTPEPSDDAGVDAGGSSKGPPLTRWREIWPLPLLGVGGLLFASGVLVAIRTAPDPVFTPAIDDASRLIEAGEYERAIDELNERVYPYVGRPELNRAAEAQYRLLLARALYGGQHELEFPQPANDENIVDQYLEAEELLGELPAPDVEKLARTHLARGEPSLAKARARSLPDPAQTASIYRELIERGRGAARPDYTDLLLTVDEYLATPGLAEPDRVWGLARRAEMQIETGYASEAIDALLRELPLLVGRDIPGIGELFVMLGRGYLEIGAPREALAELRRADSDALLDPGSAARAWGRLYLAEALERTAGDEITLRAARDRYESLAIGVNPAPVTLASMFGLARTEAALDDDEAVGGGRESPPRLQRSITMTTTDDDPEPFGAAPSPGASRLLDDDDSHRLSRDAGRRR